MPIPTEPIGSISRDQLDALYERAVVDTIRRFEEIGSPVITDGEQTKPSFATYVVTEVRASWSSEH